MAKRLRDGDSKKNAEELEFALSRCDHVNIGGKTLLKSDEKWNPDRFWVLMPYLSLMEYDKPFKLVTDPAVQRYKNVHTLLFQKKSAPDKWVSVNHEDYKIANSQGGSTECAIFVLYGPNLKRGWTLQLMGYITTDSEVFNEARLMDEDMVKRLGTDIEFGDLQFVFEADKLCPRLEDFDTPIEPNESGVTEEPLRRKYAKKSPWLAKDLDSMISEFDRLAVSKSVLGDGFYGVLCKRIYIYKSLVANEMKELNDNIGDYLATFQDLDVDTQRFCTTLMSIVCAHPQQLSDFHQYLEDTINCKLCTFEDCDGEVHNSECPVYKHLGAVSDFKTLFGRLCNVMTESDLKKNLRPLQKFVEKVQKTLRENFTGLDKIYDYYFVDGGRIYNRAYEGTIVNI